jgi:hypothetical protein
VGRLHDHPLRRLREHRPPHGRERGFSLLTAGLTELIQTLREAKAYPLTLAFLGSHLISPTASTPSSRCPRSTARTS